MPKCRFCVAPLPRSDDPSAAYAQHLKDFHGYQYNCLYKLFDNETKMKAYLQELETRHWFKFVKRRGAKRNANGARQECRYCNQSYECPVYVSIVSDDLGYEVSGILTHVGHGVHYGERLPEPEGSQNQVADPIESSQPEPVDVPDSTQDKENENDNERQLNSLYLLGTITAMIASSGCDVDVYKRIKDLYEIFCPSE